MLRVRDELKMTLIAYQTLYESSIAFGIRKALKAEQGKAEMETYIQQLEGQKARLEKEVSDLEVQCQMVEKKAVEQRQAEEKVKRVRSCGLFIFCYSSLMPRRLIT